MDSNLRTHAGLGVKGERDSDAGHPPPGHPNIGHKGVGVCTRVMRIALYSGTAALVGAAVFGGSPRPVVVSKLKALGAMRADDPDFAGKWKYLTILNAALSTGFYSVAALYELYSIWAKRPLRDETRVGRGEYILRFTRSSLVLPLALFVPGLFWGIYAFNRNLIWPPVYDQVFPRWSNQAFHTVILPVALLDVFLLGPHIVSRSQRTRSFLLFAGSAAIYLVFSYVVALNSGGHWAYPVLDTPNVALRSALLAGFSALGALFWRLSVAALEGESKGTGGVCPFQQLKAKAAESTGASEEKKKK